MASDLPHPDDLHLRAAQGWLELGNPAEAELELQHLSPLSRAHPDVLELRWHLHAQAKQWEACLVVAQRMIEFGPQRAEAWIHRSFALHELKRTQEAHDQLRPGLKLFPGVWTIPYNLACYCAQLGLLDDARQWLRKATAIDSEAVKRSAADDPDLQPLRDHPGPPPS